MENKKIILKKILVISIVLVVAICGFVFYENEDEEFLEYDQISLEESFENTDDLENTAKLENDEQETMKIKIYITGEVNNPGVKELEVGTRIEDAINTAGGLTTAANISKVNLAYQLEDGQKIYIPNMNENIEEYITKENGEGIVEESKSTTSGRVNINNADINELCELPGVGESLATRIVTYREENGKFKKVEDLKNVSGIGEKKFESLKEYVVVK